MTRAKLFRIAMYPFHSHTAREAISGGFVVFGLCSIYGLRLLWRGLRDDILDSAGQPLASRGWFIGSGILMQFPAIGFVVYVWHQGFFSS